MSQNKNSSRLVVLDLYRFLAAFFVVIYHYTYFLPTGNAEFDLINHITKYGYLGVNFFFMISGFVIYLSVENKSWINFISSRISRLFPAYWFAIIFTASFIFFFPEHIKLNLSLIDVLINLTMLQDFLDITHVDGVYWTLTVELIFYFWVFIIIFFLNRRVIPHFFTFLLLLSFVSCFFNIPKILVNVLLLDWVSYFMSGIIFYILYSNRANIYWYCILFLSLIVSLIKANKYLMYFDGDNHLLFSFTVVAAIITFMYILFFILIYFSKYMKKHLNIKLIVALGGVTYPLYLIHQNVGYIIFSIFNNINQYLLLMFLLLLMTIISWFIYIFIERNCQNYLRVKISNTLVFIKNKTKHWFVLKVGS